MMSSEENDLYGASNLKQIQYLNQHKTEEISAATATKNGHTQHKNKKEQFRKLQKHQILERDTHFKAQDINNAKILETINNQLSAIGNGLEKLHNDQKVNTNTSSQFDHYNDCQTQLHNSIQQSTPSQQSISISSHSLVDQIFSTVLELECTLLEEKQCDFNLKMALEQQTEKVADLKHSLDNEKKRNERLVNLIRGVDSSSSTDEEGGENALKAFAPNWARTSIDAYESISPLLMQHRYEELAASHKQSRSQLARKEKILKRTQGEKEGIQAKYDHLLDEYRSEQKRFEDLCYKYLKLQAKKNFEIERLKEALTYASDCVVSAQHIMEVYNASNGQIGKEFKQNLQLFIKALRLCEWLQNKCSRTTLN